MKRPIIIQLLVAIAVGFASIFFSVSRVSAQGNCEQYARTAAAQFREAKQLNCKVSSPRWHADAGLHLLWCATQPIAIPKREQNARKQKLLTCAGAKSGGPPKAGNVGTLKGKKKKQSVKKPDQWCDAYANNAVTSNKRNKSLGCGFSGRNWNNDKAQHYAFCLQVGRKEAETYQTGRWQATDKCRANQITAICRTYHNRAFDLVNKIQKSCKNNPYPSSRFEILQECVQWSGPKEQIAILIDRRCPASAPMGLIEAFA